jgi:hypothetical protein
MCAALLSYCTPVFTSVEAPAQVARPAPVQDLARRGVLGRDPVHARTAELAGLGLTVLKAVGQYEAQRREYGGLRGRRWIESFDRHSRHFAVENGVCPRCARPGDFRAEAGRCECGFCYT